jgi:hypothetical protein
MPRRNRNAGPRVGDLIEWDDGSAQLDFFGCVEAELVRRAEHALWRAEFDARTTRMPDGAPVVWTARHAFPGVRAGESIPGRRCWLCGAVVANTFVLASQHGLSVDDPSCRDATSCAAAPAAVPSPGRRCETDGGEVA